MKLDMGRAWDQTTAMIGKSLPLVAIVAALFFFLPNFAFGVLAPQGVPGMENPDIAQDPEALMEVLGAYMGQVWWALLLLILFQYVGQLGLMALFDGSRRPTLGEALSTGLRMMIPFLIAGLIMNVGLVLLFTVAVGIGGVTGVVALAVLLGAIALAAMIYISIKFVLTGPVMAIEGTANPIAALKRSWRLTKGNSARILLFLFLLGLVYMIASIVLSMFALLFGLMGEQIAIVAASFVSALTTAVFLAVFSVVLVAVYRQVGGASETGELEDTFE
ncbi:glycerophosphoryl diester phosphodiesterase membrane domain-containing protein [Qipengyuania sp. JC766]|uniref:glycerophosphoryl diester phosphodiesterase membrane domain-containing protein n=1 Tax=Qipengyuania sp. JC766 TaxID=3232139 RepID=UPI003459902A